MNIIVNYQMGDIFVDGIEGFFSQTQKVGGFMKIHHCILNDDGVGCKKRVFVGQEPIESWENNTPNPSFKRDIEQKICRYIEKMASE